VSLFYIGKEVHPKYSERNLVQCHFVYHKSYMEWSEILIFNSLFMFSSI